MLNRWNWIFWTNEQAVRCDMHCPSAKLIERICLATLESKQIKHKACMHIQKTIWRHAFKRIFFRWYIPHNYSHLTDIPYIHGHAKNHQLMSRINECAFLHSFCIRMHICLDFNFCFLIVIIFKKKKKKNFDTHSHMHGIREKRNNNSSTKKLFALFI